MNDELFERLLYEEESPTLDFKKEQYRFSKASDEEKSELLKDVLGFANAWRRSEAYILVGVEDVRGGRGIVRGIPLADHLDDHSLQQFVNNLTNRPIRFHYEAFGYEGKQVGIFRIEEQTRPLYLKKNYGKLKKNEVYVRRGSSTDPTKPASPDETAQMGSPQTTAREAPSLSIQFAAAEREHPLGERIEWEAEFCEIPELGSIPKLTRAPRAGGTPASIRLSGGTMFELPDDFGERFIPRLNHNFYREFANYHRWRQLVRQIRLVVLNTGEVPANDVRLELVVAKGGGFGIINESDIPKMPKRRESFWDHEPFDATEFRSAFRRPGSVAIEKNDHETKVEIDCGDLQPGRKIWTNAFYMGIRRSGEVQLTGHLFAANLPGPLEFSLTINAVVKETTLTVEELVLLGDQAHQPDEGYLTEP